MTDLHSVDSSQCPYAYKSENFCNSSAVAEIGDHLATIDMGRKLGARSCCAPFRRGTRNGITELSHTPPPADVFCSAVITLGIGPYSSWSLGLYQYTGMLKTAVYTHCYRRRIKDRKNHKTGTINHTNIALMSMLVWLIVPFYGRHMK